MSKALYRKYRSKSLDEVIGQKHITDILSRAISVGHISHAYLLTGPRGVGKTSVARILAHEINGLVYDESATNLDIIEIDAASNNGVEDVRDLRDKVQIAPVAAKKKIYIIDEVHMLSKAAFNALLKTLEEPPEHVVFILATTNVEKIPATIISRAQRFSFRPISTDDAVKHLSNIAKSEKINITDDALALIAERSDGSFRDSISLLDQLSNLIDTSSKEVITVELIENMLGLTPNETIDKLLEAVEAHDLNTVIELLDRTFKNGTSSAVLSAQLTAKIRDEISKKPHLLPLLDALIDVAKSPQPQLKLFSVLGLAATPKQAPKTAALLTPTLEISASVAELEKVASEDKPREIIKQKPAPTNKKEVIPEAKEEIVSKSNLVKTVAPAAFDWDKLIKHTHENYISLFVVLSKCGHEFEDNTLTIYTNNKFYKNKLDDAKYGSLLSKCLQEIGVYNLDIHTIPTTIPPKDSQAAAIAAIMGGGEEVSLGAA